MYAIAALSKIVRKDARIEVKVPATQGRKAYSYFREGAEHEEGATRRPSRKVVAGVGGAIAAAGLAGLAAIALRRKSSALEDKGNIDKEISGNKTKGSPSNVQLGVGGVGAVLAGIAATSRLRSKDGSETASSTQTLPHDTVPSEQKKDLEQDRAKKEEEERKKSFLEEAARREEERIKRLAEIEQLVAKNIKSERDSEEREREKTAKEGKPILDKYQKTGASYLSEELKEIDSIRPLSEKEVDSKLSSFLAAPEFSGAVSKLAEDKARVEAIKSKSVKVSESELRDLFTRIVSTEEAIKRKRAEIEFEPYQQAFERVAKKIEEADSKRSLTLSDTSLKFKESIPPSTKVWVRESLNDFGKLVRGKAIPTLKEIEIGKTENFDGSNRSGGSFANIERGMVFIDTAVSSKEDIRRELFHEISHHLEQSHPDIVLASKSFIAGRASGPPQTLNRIKKTSCYSPDEIAYPDKFVNPYVGKIYNDVEATEVVSVGLEHFSSRDGMRDLFRNDREHFLFMVGILKGGK